MKNMVRVLSLLSLFLLANTAQAAVVFNEFQISPTDDRFIELYNNGTEPVDLTGYYIQRKTETGTSFSSLVTSTNFEGKQIGAGKYFVISRTDVSNTNLVVGNMTLTESNTIQLKNSSGEVVDKLCLGNAGDCSGAKLAPNPAEGKSVSFINSAFVETSPTIGGANTTTADTSADTNNVPTNTESSGSTNSSASSVPIASTKKITTKVSHDDLVFSNTPALFEATTLGVNSERLIYGKYVWNFGDGVSIESKVSDNGPVTHTYYYPNDYILTVEYYSTEYLSKPDAIFQKNIKVVPSSVFISSIGNTEDFFVELTNSSQYDVNISGWQISYENQFFVLPKNTIIQKNQKISYSPKATKFNYTESKDFALYNSNSELIFKYQPKTSVKKIVSTTNGVRANTANFSSSPNNKEVSGLGDDLDKVYDLTGDDLTARGYAGLPRGYDKGPYVYGFGLLALLSISGSGVYFLRRSKRFKQEGDFEVFDE